MAECPTAVILAAFLLSSGFHIFTRSYEKVEGCGCVTLSSILFLTAVFAWVSATNINIFRCRLPEKYNFFYEFIISMFIFEMALRLFWEPLECFLSTTLPSALESWLMGDGECCFLGLYCPGDSLLFVLLVYATALSFVWSVLYGYGVLSVKL
ncbi:uncharacterized protein LOC128985865 [Macrosteles quadrilineatus]|uniref:uncharacterized protein LOC128985865 n=1 Tax=Macrosteles quadrilineatus TaxID=74068 RepID=UPI0023E22144|nr:uncharacterized protein LOC128985865 [Macrosteles quadrilineatus]